MAGKILEKQLLLQKFDDDLVVAASVHHGGGDGSSNGGSEVTSVLMISIFIAVVGSFLGGCSIFPLNIKGAAGSLAIIVSYLSDMIVSYTFNFMLGWSSSGTFLILTIVNLFSILFVAKMVPETKGRTLEEIQVLLTQ